MPRRASNFWNCIICDRETEGIICYKCAERERERQRNEPGSLTYKQLSYIEYLVSDLDTKTTGEVLLEICPDYAGELETLSANQAGGVIAKLLPLQKDAAQQSVHPTGGTLRQNDDTQSDADTAKTGDTPASG
jgi:hypothetical protein